MIRVHGVSKRIGATQILDDLSLTVASGSFVALLGPSGSGKTTLLRIIAGLDAPDSGTLELDGRAVANLPPSQRGLGFVFQSYGLFEHMTVAGNIGFGLQIRKPRLPRAQIAATVARMLSLVQLDGLGPRMPAQLSGGQRQRVALARTLAVEPRVLLLDEPFGALDRNVREDLRGALRQIHDTLGMTTLFVTHDHEEAAALADRCVTLERGRITGEVHTVSRPAASAPRREHPSESSAVPLGRR